MNKNAILYVMAKKPIPGKVKTRLAKQIGDHAAAQIAEELIELTCRKVKAVWPGAISLAVWPDENHPLFNTLQHKYGFEMCTLRDLGILGERWLV